MLKKNEILGVIILCLISSIAGYIWGYSSAMDFCVEIAMKVTDIDIKPEVLDWVIGRYGNRI